MVSELASLSLQFLPEATSGAHHSRRVNALGKLVSIVQMGAWGAQALILGMMLANTSHIPAVTKDPEGRSAINACTFVLPAVLLAVSALAVPGILVVEDGDKDIRHSTPGTCSAVQPHVETTVSKAPRMVGNIDADPTNTKVQGAIKRRTLR